MKTELKAKLIQQVLRNKKENEGFTLIELLVVIIIIGILSAIALPSFLNQANKAKQSEAKTYIGSMNRGQQAHFLENDDFTNDISELGLGIKTETAIYQYTAEPKGSGTDRYVVNYSQRATNVTTPVKDYIGKVYLATFNTNNTSNNNNNNSSGGSDEYTAFAFLCETKAVGAGIKDLSGTECPEATTKPVGSKKKKKTDDK